MPGTGGRRRNHSRDKPRDAGRGRDVLNRPEIRALKPDLSPAEVARFLEAVAYRSVVVRDVPSVLTWPRDPKDAPYMNLAVAAETDYLVTRDKDLLALNSDHSAEGKQFRQLSRNRVQILTPAEFLQRVRPPAGSSP
jgi:predicted nucleic acid-binding protein